MDGSVFWVVVETRSDVKETKNARFGVAGRRGTLHTNKDGGESRELRTRVVKGTWGP